MREEKADESRTTDNLPKPLRVEEEWRARTVVVGWPGEDELEGWLFLLEPPPRRLEAKAKKPTLARGDLGEEGVEEIELSVDGVNWCWRKGLLVVVTVLLATLGLVIALVLLVLTAFIAGVALFFLRNLTQVLGEAGEVPPAFAAFTPPLVAALLALTVLLRLEE